MKVIGFSAGSVGREGNVDRMVKAILDKSGHDAEFVKLTDLNFSGCKGCVQLRQTGTSVLFVYLHQMTNLIFKQHAP